MLHFFASPRQPTQGATAAQLSSKGNEQIQNTVKQRILFIHASWCSRGEGVQSFTAMDTGDFTPLVLQWFRGC